jgi:hypothetical protein
MWLRIATIVRIARVNCDQAYRRIHGAGMMQTRFAGLLEDLRGRRDAYETFFREPGAELPNAAQDLVNARRRLAGEALEYACAQLKSAEPDRDEIAEYIGFASETQQPGEAPAWQWGEYRRLTKREQRATASREAYLRYCAVRRDLENRYRWSRWRLTGV